MVTLFSMMFRMMVCRFAVMMVDLFIIVMMR